MREIALVFLRLGATSFGGPAAHLGYFHAEFVRRRAWLGEREFADLIALCQFLPGPASSQAAYAIGASRAGVAGGLLASACFLLPSAALMIGFGYGVAALGDVAHAGWVRGLKIAAVAVVAQAVWSMSRALCPDAPRAGIALVAAVAALMAPGAWSQIAVIAAGAVVGWAAMRSRDPADDAAPSPARRSRRAGAAALVVFAALLVALPLIARATGERHTEIADAFYRSGSLVFGGGHVVLPLLRAETVPRGWISDEAFLAGYGAAQAVPGPLFSFAGYLGVAIAGGGAQSGAWLTGLLALAAIYAPALLLIAGALPFWDRLRASASARGGLRGANAAVVGVLLAALVSPIGAESIKSMGDAAVALAALAGLVLGRAPPVLVALACAVAGHWLLGPR